jgi:hypothetical protein
MARSKATISDDQLSALETYLAGALRRVNPPTDVVTRLRERIRMPQPGEIVSRFREWKRMFVVFGGVMSGLLVMITVGRALYYLIGRKQV